MATVQSLIGRPLRWEQGVALKAQFKLLHGEEQVMQLRLLSVVTWAATVENGQNVNFEQFNAGKAGGVHVRYADSTKDIATYVADDYTRSGTLSFADGRTLSGRGDSQFRDFELRTTSQEVLLRIERDKNFWRFQARFEVLPAAAAFRDEPWLMGLNAYLLLLALGEPGL